MTAHAALEASAVRMEAGFAGVAEQLAAVRGGMLAIMERLAELDHVLSGQGAQDRVMDAVEQAVQHVKEALKAASAVAAPARVQAAFFAAEESVKAIESQTRMLDAVANLSLITAKSLGLEGFDNYVRNLRSLGDAMRREAVQVEAALTALRRQRQRAGELFEQAEASLAQVDAVLAAHARARDDSGRALRETIAGVAAVAERVPRILTAETDALVRAMQFSDAAAQRIDHIRTILSRDGAAELALAAAQIGALVAATQDTVQQARTSLSRIESVSLDSGGVLAVTQDAQDRSGTAAVENSHRLLSSIGQVSERAFEAIRVASEVGTALDDLARQAAERFAFLADASDEIHIAAINATLLSRTDTGQERAMSVLSVDVQQQAAICNRSTDRCRRAMVELTLGEDLAVFAEVSDKAAVFRQSMTETSAAVSRAEAALAAMEKVRLAAAGSLQSLVPALRQGQESLDRIAETADQLRRLSENLPQAIPPGSSDLSDIMNLYTMDAERAVHRRLFGLPNLADPGAKPGRPAPTPSQDAGSDSDLLASVLF